MKLSLIFLFIFSHLGFSKEDDGISDVLKGVRFSDEKFKTKKDAPFYEWGASALYSFYALSSIDRINDSSSNISSELSPGFGLFYRQRVSPKIDFGFRTEYQRIIFQPAMVNNLNKNTADFFLGGVYSSYHFSDYIEFKLEAGYESRLFLESVSRGVANLETINRAYGEILASFKLPRFFGKKGLSVAFDIGYKHNSEKSSDSITIEASGTSILGVRINSQSRSHNYKLSLHYLNSDFEVNGTAEQNLRALRLQFQLLFGGE